jgi:hypothetical protein
LQTPDFICAGFQAFPLGRRVLIAHPQAALMRGSFQKLKTLV